jgi:hypothetical protein
LFEVRKPKTPALISPFDGVISFSEKGRLRYITVTSEHQKKIYSFADGYTAIVKKGDLLAKVLHMQHKVRVD